MYTVHKRYNKQERTRSAEGKYKKKKGMCVFPVHAFVNGLLLVQFVQNKFTGIAT